MTPHVVISDAKSTTVDHDLQRDILERYGAKAKSTITRTEDALLEELGDVAGLIVDAGVPVTARVLENAPSLEVVGRAGIGVDNVDLEAAADLGVTVVHNPTYSIDEVATHALSLLLACVRRVPTYDRQTRSKGWDWAEGQPVRRLQGSTIGFLGFGKIPRRLATMIQGFGCELLAHDPYLTENVVRTHNVELVGFEELLSRVDFLSIHVPYTDETEAMIDADALATMSDDAVLVNTARGPVVDTESLVVALEAGAIDFAGLDVTDPEPLPDDHPLLGLENAVVTPHVGWYSEASREQLSEEIAEDVGRVLIGETPRNEVTTDTQWV
ncbi:MAG: C-terminal binding protein [Natronomonas sp.]|jgi:D-3-phosphoglycerate dehydrogenase|uniref:C-terminal binding protein n=1 Tax=Natronomonas sp. TaxID=2184060 RepID=UPI00287028AE|nr:C-terminal binding protein [Natronomonas sp.]MDR9429420.1 C-terminal binding protein [Natronomonas sp.]